MLNGSFWILFSIGHEQDKWTKATGSLGDN
jgi:hypothetical protein